MDKKDFTYTCNADGYMLYYKGKPIGGAGVMLPRSKPLHWRHKRTNLVLFGSQAEDAIKTILTGNLGHHKEALDKIAGKQ